MADQSKRRKTEFLMKLANQKKESKLWYEEANSHIKAGNLPRAIYSYNKALELNPCEKNALVARSKCYILLGQPENALKDAETALNIDKSFMKAIYQKGESLYYLGDFEHSLMYYYRGLHIRPDHEGFKLGVYKAQKAIENAIGTNFPGILQANSSKNNSDKSARSRRTSTELNSKGKRTNTPSTTTTNTAASQRTATTMSGGVANKSKSKSRLLRELGTDKDYLDNLINNPNIKCKFKEDDSTIEDCIKDTVNYLNARQEFWRQQLPANYKYE